MKKAGVLRLIWLAWFVASSHQQETTTITDEVETAEDASEEVISLDDEQTSDANESPVSIDTTQQDTDTISEKEATQTEMVDIVPEESESAENDEMKQSETDNADAPVQSGPFIDLLGPNLLSMKVTGDTGEIQQHLTNEALRGKNVIGLYFSADWCGPCRQFTPDLVKFYHKMNARRGHKDKFEIVWISRCRDVNGYAQYMAQMPWPALPPELAMGALGHALSDHYGVKGIPTLVLLDEVGSVITTDARNLLPKDKAGIGFPWYNPITKVYMTLLPRTVRLMLRTQVDKLKQEVAQRLKSLLGLPRKAKA